MLGPKYRHKIPFPLLFASWPNTAAPQNLPYPWEGLYKVCCLHLAVWRLIVFSVCYHTLHLLIKLCSARESKREMKGVVFVTGNFYSTNKGIPSGKQPRRKLNLGHFLLKKLYTVDICLCPYKTPQTLARRKAVVKLGIGVGGEESSITVPSQTITALYLLTAPSEQ